MLILLTFLAACGGGGSGSSTPDTPTNDNTSETETIFTTLEIPEIDVSGYSKVINKNIALQQGWNLVALPVDITLTDTDLATYINDYTDVYSFDNVLCGDFDPELITWNALDNKSIGTIFSGSTCWKHNPEEIEAGEGFWIYVNTAQDVEFDGDTYGIDEKLSNLNNGWHLLGTSSNMMTASFANFTDATWTLDSDTLIWSEDSLLVTGGKGFWFFKGNTADTLIRMSASEDTIFNANQKSDAVAFTDAQCSSPDTDTQICDNQTLAQAQAIVGKPLFIGGSFKGIVQSVNEQSGKISYAIQAANDVTDVYDNFDIELTGEEINERLSRAIHKFKGKYDYLNTKPLKFELKTVEVPATEISGPLSRNRSKDGKIKEFVLRVNFPKGYTIPIQPKRVDCDFWESSCDARIDANMDSHIDLGDSITKGGITISTEGSYVDFGLGAYMRAKYDANLFEEDVYVFEVSTSAYFESNIIFTINGEYEFEWSDNIELLDMVDVEIAHPYSAVAKAVVGFQPVMEIGSRGSLNVSMEAKAHSKREGEVGFRYSSIRRGVRPMGRVSFHQSTENGVTFEASVNGEVYIIPRVAVRPKLMFLRVSQPLSFGEIRGGVKVNSILEGQVNTDFVVGNNSYNIDIGKTEIGLDIGVSALIDYILQIRLGDKEFWSMDDYRTLYESNRLIVFDWHIGLLQAPTYDDAAGQSDSGKDIQFETPDTDYPDLIQYYYQTIPVGQNVEMPNLLTFRNTASLLDSDTLNLTESAIVLVQSVLKNSDISDSVWMSFGTSLSPISMFAVEVEEEEEPAEQCDANNLNLCLDQVSCEVAGGEWDNDQCQSASDPVEPDDVDSVTSPHTGRIWMDRNLGASRVCTSINDEQCFGDYLAYSGINCPNGYRIPNIAEVYDETINAGNEDAIDLFNSFLKMPTTASTHTVEGTFGVGEYTRMWSSDFCRENDTYTHCVDTAPDLIQNAVRGYTEFSTTDSIRHYLGGGVYEYWTYRLYYLTNRGLETSRFPARCIKDN